MECAERFLQRHALEGYEPHLHAALGVVRGDVEAGRPDVPAADIVAAEIKRVRGLKRQARLPSACLMRVCSWYGKLSVRLGSLRCTPEPGRWCWPLAANSLVGPCLVPLCLSLRRA